MPSSPIPHVSTPLLPSFPTRRSSDLVADGHRHVATRRRLRVACGRRREGVGPVGAVGAGGAGCSRDTRYTQDRKSTRLNSSHDQISYAVFCLKKISYTFECKTGYAC